MDIRDIILLHLKRRPLMRARDIYKLLYQAVFGVGHIMGEEAWQRLKEETERIDPEDHPEEPLVEEISPNGEMIRVNLRPFLRMKLPLDALYRAMLETQATGNAEDIKRYWQILYNMIKRGKIDLPSDEVRKIQSELQSGKPKPKHHTDEYRTAYYPAYRVVEREAWNSHFLKEE